MIKIMGTGSAAASRVVTNNDLAAIGETSDEWIQTRTGISERRMLAEGETLEGLAERASLDALTGSGLAASELDLIIVGTFTPTNFTPNTASTLKKKLGAERAIAFDLNAACSGFVYAVWVMESLMKANGYKNALVVGAEALSTVTNWEDRSTFVLFGDGAGAAVFQAGEGGKSGILASCVHSYDDVADSLIVTGIDVATPFNKKEDEKSIIKMDGATVFKFATATCTAIIEELIEKAGITIEQVDYIVPHQANGRIVDYVAGKLGVPKEKFFKNMDRYGNTSAASVPIALHEMWEEKKPKAGEIVLVVAFGGGLTAGGFVMEV